MAVKTIRVSDLSGAELLDGKGAVVRVIYHDKRKGVAVLDVTEEEANELAERGRKQQSRGRKPATD